MRFAPAPPSTFEAPALVKIAHGERDDPSSIDYLVEGLSRPGDLDALVRDFDAGNTLVRDISFLTTNERQTILNIAAEDRHRLTLEEFASCEKAADHLRDGMGGAIDTLQPWAGWNFLVNAQGFITAGYPWARQFDVRFTADNGLSIQQTLDGLQSSEPHKQQAHQLVADLAAKRENYYSVGYYLAGRSQLSEAYQEERFGSHLQNAKIKARAQIERLGPQMGLSPTHQERALQQVDRVRFSAFDHLLGGVTVGDNNGHGDYLPGTLRIEIKDGGDPSRSREAERPDHTARHEVLHASSAQAVDYNRGGLSIDGIGRDGDEGLTEFLTQEAEGFPDIVPTSHGWFGVRSTASYDTQLASMYGLHKTRPELFATLYRAYYGQVDSKPHLRTAFNMFHRALSASSRTL